ncbi:cuticle protein 70, isoforms A and B-like [Musca vetustissima]|uniref:cuticle protein 70, isoforms A and B-like n=1 Tax=Musca vetustissima TaxID=27455 RepID=UPI002AB7A77D|nr:cuticle protein 70, isoforms A and B-like [Musca vetustissima]
MFKFVVVIFAMIACAAAKPGLVTPLAYTAPAAVVAAAPAPFVTATSSQYVARNYNGIATAPVVAPVVAKTVAAPIVAKTFAAPVAAAYTTPVVAKYAATYAAPFAYSAPLTYAAAPAPVLF